MVAQDENGSIAVRALDDQLEASWRERLAGGELCYFDGGSWSLRCLSTADPNFFHALAIALHYGRAHLGPPSQLDGVDAEAAAADVFKHQVAPAHLWRVLPGGEAELLRPLAASNQTMVMNFIAPIQSDLPPSGE